MPKKFYVCGWSLGGKLALLLAEKAPERILGLVLIATNPIFLETSLWPGIKQHAFTTLYREFLSSFKSALKTFLSLQIIGSRQSTALKKSLSPFLLLDVSREQVSLSFEILAIDQLSIMKKIRVPTRFFLFKQDKLVPFAVAKNIAAVNNRFVQAEVIDNSAHGSIVFMLGPISDVLRSLL
jgi:pimeloyl-[acyl-carrier protein] methyl ester esterase